MPKIDVFRATVRPVVTYIVVGVFCALAIIDMSVRSSFRDIAIAIIAFWFGSRVQNSK